jgi:ParB family chromosome partitioning protein
MEGEFATVPVADVRIGSRHRKDAGDLQPLCDSIVECGLMHAIVVRRVGDALHLVAGWRRLQALKKLGRTEVAVHVVAELDDALAALRAERDENTCRKDFTPTERVALGEELEKLERAEAKRRQREGGRSGGKAGGKLPQASAGKTRDKVAEALGTSGRSYEKTKVVIEAAKADPSLTPVVEEMDRTGKVDAAYKKVKAATTPPQPATTGQRLMPRNKPVEKLVINKIDGDGPQPRAADGSKPADQGVFLAAEAVNYLHRIRENDGQRKRGYQYALDWLLDRVEEVCPGLKKADLQAARRCSAALTK